jgi:tetratricopeptide (TPR) repeat protein
MTDQAHSADQTPAGFFGELRRRRVLSVAAVYLVAGGLLLELSGFLLEKVAAPGWIGRLLAIAFVVGFAVAVVIAWVVRREAGGGWVLDSSRGQRRAVWLAVLCGVAVTAALAALLLPRFEDAPVVPDYDPLPHSVAVLPLLDPDYTPAEVGIGSILYQALTQGLNASRELTQVQLKLKQAPPDQIALGRQVRVVALLAGRILREAGETEVEMQLLDVARGVPFWTRRFAWDATRIMDRGTELAHGVLQTLGLSEVAPQRFAGTDNREAYDALLMAQDLAFTTFRPVDYERSLPYFERAIELDPGYVQAYLDLCVVLHLMDGFSTDAAERQQRAKRKAWALETARTLAPDSPDVLSALGLEKLRAGQWELAVLAFERVLQRDPDHAPTLFRNAIALRGLLRFEESLAAMSKVVEQDPLNANRRGEYAMSLYGASLTEEAKAEARRAVELEPELAWGWILLSAWEAVEGHLDEAVIYERKRLYALGDSSMHLDRGCGFLLEYYAALGATEEAIVRLEKCVEAVASADRPGRLFIALSLLGRHDLGVEYARRFAQFTASSPEQGAYPEWGGFQYRLLGYLQAGEPEQAWAFYRRGAPETLAWGEAVLAGEEIESDDLFAERRDPVLYVWLLLQIGQEEKARALLHRMAEFLDQKCAGTTTAQRRGPTFHECRNQPTLHGFLGQRDETLAALRRAIIDDSWAYPPAGFYGALDFLQDDPEYLEIMQVLENRLAVQRERVRALERNGELPMAQWEIEARAALAAQLASEAPDG